MEMAMMIVEMNGEEEEAQYQAMTWRLEASLPTDHLRLPLCFQQTPTQAVPCEIVPKMYPWYGR